MIVKRGITFRYTLQLIVEVYHDFTQGHVEDKLHAVTRYVFLLHELAALAEAKRHDRADEIAAGNHRRAYIRLLDMVDERGVGQARGIVHLKHFAAFVVDSVAYVGHRGDHIHVELAAEALLYDFHVEQAEEAAAETEAESLRRLGRECQRGVVEL